MMKKIPEFANEDEEREFWSTHDSSEYIDWKKARRVTLPNLKPSTKTISIRLPESMIEDLRRRATNKYPMDHAGSAAFHGGDQDIQPLPRNTSPPWKAALPAATLHGSRGCAFVAPRLKVPANKRDIPYQSLLKMILADRIKQELGSSQ